MKRRTILNSSFPRLLALIAALLLTLTLLLCGLFYAWFSRQITVTTSGTLTSFETTVSYSFDGKSWTAYEADTPVAVTPNTINDLRFRVQYHGESAAYLRVKAYGAFYNTISDTALPLPSGFWELSAADGWSVAEDGYYYRAQRIENAAKPVLAGEFALQADIASLGTVSERQEVRGEVYFLVDAVQPERTASLWGVAVPLT